MNYKSTNPSRLFSQSWFQVRVSHALEPPPIENLLPSGKLLGRFRKEKSGSFGKCSNKYVSFDFAPESQFGQFFVILTWRQTVADGEIPEVKMYGEREDWRGPVEGDFFNFIGQKLLYQIFRTFLLKESIYIAIFLTPFTLLFLNRSIASTLTY